MKEAIDGGFPCPDAITAPCLGIRSVVGGAKRGDEAGFGATGEPTERERDPLCQGPVLVQGLVKGTGYVRAKEEPRLVGWIISFKQQHATARFVQVLLMF